MTKRTMEWRKLPWGEVGPCGPELLIPMRVYRSVCCQYQCEEHHDDVWRALKRVPRLNTRYAWRYTVLLEGADLKSAMQRCKQEKEENNA